MAEARLGPTGERRRIDALVHLVLLAGGALAGLLLLAAIVAALAEHRGLPQVPERLSDVLRAVRHLEPAGLASLGLVILILTPVARVVGSVVAFAWMKDWRFTLITLLVLTLMGLSLYFGQG